MDIQEKTSLIAATNPELVSICIPLYNGSAYIRIALASCINQTYSNIEIVVVDDGSADDSVAMVESLASSSGKIKLYRNAVNQGLVGNWKKCVELASGSWIKFLFHDDYMETDCVEKMMQACHAHNTQFALCARNFIFDETTNKGTAFFLANKLNRPEDIFLHKQYFTPAETAPLISSFLLENILGEPICTLFHKDVYKAVGGYDDSLRQWVDYEFALKIVLNHPFVFLKEKLVHFRVHSDSATSRNTSVETKKDLLKPTNILSMEGDFLKMLSLYQTHKMLAPIKEYWGAERLYLYMKYIYLRACKKKGKKRVQSVLTDIIAQNDVLKDYGYNLLKYKWVKRQFTRQVKPYVSGGTS